jgi:hypothetical protein
VGKKLSKVRKPPPSAYSLHSSSYDKKPSQETITCNE